MRPYDRFVLTRLGLLRRIGLDPRLFERREEAGGGDSTRALSTAGAVIAPHKAL